MMLRRIAIVLALGGSSCGSEEVGSEAHIVSVDSIAEKAIDHLDSLEAEALCAEDGRRMDWCMRAGMAKFTEAECLESVKACEETGQSSSDLDCTGVDFGPPGTCTTTVRDYLACVEAWNARYTCENAGLLIETPEVCRSVVEGCPRLATEFMQNGIPPQCPPVTEPEAPTHADDVYGEDGCRPVPARFVILGDSIAQCYFTDEADCGPFLVAEHVRQTFAPELAVESHARGGAITAELPDQAKQVEGGPGHVFVWVYAIGNDLIVANVDYEGWNAAWSEVFAYFTDAARFPDGATFLLNTQYSPYDQCPDPPGPTIGVADSQETLLQDVNRALFLDVAERRPDTVAVDHYRDWLGHGRNANIRACPHCGGDNTHWLMGDGLHPNRIGHAQIAAKMNHAVDRMLGATCNETGR